MAYRLLAAFILFWMIYFIPYIIFSNIINLNGTWTCSITNSIYLQYHIKFYTPVLSGPLPLLITITFALLAYHNIKQLAHRAVPIIRREFEQANDQNSSRSSYFQCYCRATLSYFIIYY